MDTLGVDTRVRFTSHCQVEGNDYHAQEYTGQEARITCVVPVTNQNKILGQLYHIKFDDGIEISVGEKEIRPISPT